MLVTQKCQYALRAVLELAHKQGCGPVKIAQIAEEQGIPSRFLEVILSQLKQGGFVESRRGADGGYLLAREAREISVADVIAFIDGPIGAVEEGPSRGEADVFHEVWRRAAQELTRCLGETTIEDLKQSEESMRGSFAPNYQI